MLKDIPQTLTCPVCRSQIPFTLSGLLLGERFTCPGCPAIVSLSTESRQTVQSVTDEFDRILHRQTFMENDLPSVAQKFTGLPWEELIGSSLNATENAEAALAMYMTRFLKEHGLEDSFESILIEMNLSILMLKPRMRIEHRKTSVPMPHSASPCRLLFHSAHQGLKHDPFQNETRFTKRDTQGDVRQ